MGPGAHRQQLIAAGARPFLYVSREERDQMKAVLPRRTYNRCVVYEPGREDWLHEREWRLCFEDDVEPGAAHHAAARRRRHRRYPGLDTAAP
ncbi:hypothetical protein [Streptomyces hydrogenans]|uniref:hypothetical protein n=1 Tax=Streptomyces hydrogenans TaxID=1873719 RepID=UPI001CFEA479|nr:hypothetical protein [Streptomyces hydrogenans]